MCLCAPYHINEGPKSTGVVVSLWVRPHSRDFERLIENEHGRTERKQNRYACSAVNTVCIVKMASWEIQVSFRKHYDVVSVELNGVYIT